MQPGGSGNKITDPGVRRHQFYQLSFNCISTTELEQPIQYLRKLVCEHEEAAPEGLHGAEENNIT